jgi:hypothetical protein
VPEEVPQGTPAWSLDDVDDEALMARLKKLPGFADLFTDPVGRTLGDPVKTEHYAPPRNDDGVMAKIATALEKLGDRQTSSVTPASPAPPQVVEKIVETAHSWFWDT